MTLERALIDLRSSTDSFAHEMGFESERERLEMILSVPAWHEDALWTWLDADGTKDGLLKILATKRTVRRTTRDD